MMAFNDALADGKANPTTVVLAPMQARADGWVTPWIGTAFGSSIENGRGTFGVSAGGMGAGPALGRRAGFAGASSRSTRSAGATPRSACAPGLRYSATASSAPGTART